MCTLLITFLQNVTLCVAYVTKISDHSLSIFSSILSPTACDHTIYMCHVFCITRNFYKIKCKLLYWQLAARTRAYFLTSIKVQAYEACVICIGKTIVSPGLHISACCRCGFPLSLLLSRPLIKKLQQLSEKPKEYADKKASRGKIQQQQMCAVK